MATNDFQPFATGAGANVMTQADYLALAALTTGFQSGVGKSAQLNKVWRQAATIAAMIGQFIADKAVLDALDNGDIPTLEARFIAALNATTGTLLPIRGIQSFTTSGTWTIPAGVTQIRARIRGGGGGGGGANAPSSAAVGGSGGGGAYAEGLITGLTPGSTLTITVGTGGSAGASTGGNGGNGTQSQVGTITAGGGGGGSGATNSASSTPGAGGVAAGGAVNINGNPGGTFTVVGSNYMSTGGGSSFGSSGAVGSFSGVGNNGGLPGSGASAATAGIGQSFAGGVGAAGSVILEW